MVGRPRVGRLRVLAMYAVLALCAVSALSGCAAFGIVNTPSLSDDDDGKTDMSDMSTVVVDGSAVPSVSPGFPGARPTRRAPLVLPPGNANRPARVKPSPTCGARIQEGIINGLSVSPGTTSAAVTWQSLGSLCVQSYLVAAHSQVLVRGEQAELDWQPAQPSQLPGPHTATVTGLTSGTPYVFIVRMIRVNAEFGGVRDTVVARSSVVTTT